VADYSLFSNKPFGSMKCGESIF